jgi:hypothetical protein
MPCAPKDLVYDDSQKQCDYESASNVCKVQTEAPTTEIEICPTEPETETPTTDAPTDSTTDTPIDSTTDDLTDSTTDTPTDAPTTSSSEFVCPKEDIANTGCKGQKDCLYPNPESCDSFIQCVPQSDGSGIPQEMPCPAGLEWNDTKKECDWPEDSTCPNI